MRDSSVNFNSIKKLYRKWSIRLSSYKPNKSKKPKIWTIYKFKFKK